MRHAQIELFGGGSGGGDRRPPDGEIVAIVRRRLTETLARVRVAATMPWDGPLRIIREENAFRYGKDVLPPEEGARLWAAFDAEMDRLYATIPVAPVSGDDASLGPDSDADTARGPAAELGGSSTEGSPGRRVNSPLRGS